MACLPVQPEGPLRAFGCLPVEVSPRAPPGPLSHMVGGRERLLQGGHCLHCYHSLSWMRVRMFAQVLWQLGLWVVPRGPFKVDFGRHMQ